MSLSQNPQHPQRCPSHKSDSTCFSSFAGIKLMNNIVLLYNYILEIAQPCKVLVLLTCEKAHQHHAQYQLVPQKLPQMKPGQG